jgi:hypothetical protein
MRQYWEKSHKAAHKVRSLEMNNEPALTTIIASPLIWHQSSTTIQMSCRHLLMWFNNKLHGDVQQAQMTRNCDQSAGFVYFSPFKN